eukprot:356712-Chlamydomonas_euryale.AAC.8
MSQALPYASADCTCNECRACGPGRQLQSMGQSALTPGVIIGMACTSMLQPEVHAQYNGVRRSMRRTAC